MKRCCDTHPDWDTLLIHLMKEHPTVGEHDVAASLGRARAATDYISLDTPDQLATAELICRHDLAVTLGDAPDNARLDPESRPRHHRDGD
jgi:hypothetical protein